MKNRILKLYKNKCTTSKKEFISFFRLALAAIFFSILLFSQKVSAQGFACPQVTVSPNVSICNGCTPLTATVQGTVATTSYTVASTAYNPFSYTTGTSVLLGIDDTWSSVISLPFCFQFYGTTYNQVVIGSNAILSFDVSNAGNYNTWPISSAMPNAGVSDMLNCIMAPWHDIDPSVNSNSTPTIKWSIQGTAPCRAFVVSWANVSMFSCNSMIATSQVVLYETTNIIDIYIQNKPTCAGWNSGAAIEGIQNASGTQGVIVPGRNYPTQWTATNDGQRFTPSGAPQYTLSWLDPSNTVVGTTPTISVCPTVNTTYTAKVINTTCNGPITVTAQVTVSISPPPCTTTSCSFIAHGDTVCEGETILLTADSVPNASYGWIGPNGFISLARNPSITNADSSHTGWYYVKDSIPSCSYLDSVFVKVNANPTVNAGSDQTVCATSVTLAGLIGGGATSGTWSGGSGTYNPNNTSLNAIYTLSPAEISAGTVVLTLTTDDPAGSCNAATDQMTITVSQSSTANAGSAQHVCSGSTITLAGSIGGSATGATWSGGAGTYAPDNTTLNAVYTPSTAEYAADSVLLTLTTPSSGSCAGSSSNVTMYFYENPVVNFVAGNTSGCPTLCVDFTDSTTIAGNNAIDSWTWTFGDNSPSVSTQNPSHCFSATGSYDVTLTTQSNNGCTSTVTKTNFVQIFSIPNADFNPTPNPTTVIDPTVTMDNLSSSDVTYWNWDFGDGTFSSPNTASPIHDYPNDTALDYIVTLIVHNADDCYDTMVHTVVVGPGFTFYMPNSFSPNGNGVNDYFYGTGTGIKKYDMWIFDRWGNKIFHGKTISDKWDGTMGDNIVKSIVDVYVWKVSLIDIFNKSHEYTGTVTLLK